MRECLITRFRQLTVTHDAREVWEDFLVVSFCSLCWTDGEVCQAEIAAVEARYTCRENELLAEMFAIVDREELEEIHRSLEMGKWASGLLRYIVDHI